MVINQRVITHILFFLVDAFCENGREPNGGNLDAIAT